MRTWLCLPFFIGLSSCIQAETAAKVPENSYCQIIEKIINLPDLQQYFHVNVFPERAPLVILVDQFINSCVELNKFGKPVIIISSNNIEKLPSTVHLKFVNINITPVNAEAVFTYSPEGIKGMVKLKKDKSQWIVFESKIVEM